MKQILLTTTALVALTGAAAAELTISGTGRIGFLNTEGATKKDAVTTYGKIGKAAKDTFALFGDSDAAAKAHKYTSTQAHKHPSTHNHQGTIRTPSGSPDVVHALRIVCIPLLHCFLFNTGGN